MSRIAARIEKTPKIEKIDVAARGDVRRAKLYYLRDRVGKGARVRERDYYGPEDDIAPGLIHEPVAAADDPAASAAEDEPVADAAEEPAEADSSDAAPAAEEESEQPADGSDEPSGDAA